MELRISPSSAVIGPGQSAAYILTLANVGDAADTYRFAPPTGLPAGYTAVYSSTAAGFTPASGGAPATITVPAGTGNVRRVTLTITPPPTAAAGAVSFGVTAASTTAPTVVSTANAGLTVLANGVSLALTPGSTSPGGTLSAVVTNTGKVADTFTLSLAGPAALVSTLGATKVTLAPGTSQAVAIRTTGVGFAVPGALPLTAVAVSTGNPSVRDSATAALNIGTTKGLAAHFERPVQALAADGRTTFRLLVDNKGNAEDQYTATIIGATGPVAPSLIGPDGLPTPSIRLFRLSGLSEGAILLRVNDPTIKAGTVTVRVQSLTDPSESVTATAVVNAASLTTTTLAASPSASVVGQAVTFTAVVTGAIGGPTPSGTVDFYDATAKRHLGLVSLVNGAAKLVVSDLSVGSHAVTASYGGDAIYPPSASAPAVVTVTKSGTPGGGTGGTPPVVKGVARYGVHWMPTTLVVSFSQRLDASRAQDVNNYVILDPQGRRIVVDSAVYDPAAMAVTLHPHARMNFHYGYRLILNGSNARGLANGQGVLLDGNGDKTPGGDYATIVDRRNLVWGVRTPRPAITAAVLFLKFWRG